MSSSCVSSFHAVTSQKNLLPPGVPTLAQTLGFFSLDALNVHAGDAGETQACFYWCGVLSRWRRRAATCSEGIRAVDAVPAHLSSETRGRTSEGLNEGDTYGSRKSHGVADRSHDAPGSPCVRPSLAAPGEQQIRPRQTYL